MTPTLAALSVVLIVGAMNAKFLPSSIVAALILTQNTLTDGQIVYAMLLYAVSLVLAARRE